MIEHSFYLLLDDTDTVLMHIFVTTNGVFFTTMICFLLVYSGYNI